jgi:hypothetical protein
MTEQNGPQHGPSPLGDELAHLLSVVQDWAQRNLPAPPSGSPGPECQWCPLCQLASVLRGEHPELTERMDEAGAAVTAAVRAVLDSANRHMPQPGSSPARKRPSPAPRVEHIRLADRPPST